MKKILLLSISLLILSCKGNSQDSKKKEYKVSKSEAAWKNQLTDQEYYVLRQAGTERAFTSPLNKNYDKGIYICKACETPLFKSKHKYDSGSGWPSFDREIKGNIEYSSNSNPGYFGIEEHCATCGSHLGHIFNDGPSNTTGKRHCINGVALKFIPKE